MLSKVRVALFALALAMSPGLVSSATPPPPASAAPADADNVALVKRYFAAVKLDQRMRELMKSLVPVMVQEESGSIQGLTPEQTAAVTGATEDAAADWFPSYFDKMAQIYARIFTHDELQAMLTFYESPVGQSITAKSASLAPIATQVMQESLPEFKAAIAKRLCERLDCSKLKGAGATNAELTYFGCAARHCVTASSVLATWSSGFRSEKARMILSSGAITYEVRSDHPGRSARVA